MQFKHPEVLFFLFLLLIPLLIHLFQLQKFKKEAFTNVKFLKQIELETRKSSRLKKLLILASRMFALAALIFAFSQPFLNRNKGLQKKKSIVYIDNSLSLQAKGSNGIEQLQFIKNTLLDQSAYLGDDIDLITNDRKFSNLDPKGLNKEMLNLGFSPVKIDINQILLQINDENKNDKNTLINVILISDFQTINKVIDTGLIRDNYDYSLLDLSNNLIENIVLDTAWIAKNDGKQIAIKARLRSQNLNLNDLSVSLMLNEELYGKSSLSLKNSDLKEVEFMIPASGSNYGHFSITDHRLNFDNQLFFSIPQRIKKKVLIIGNQNEFLERIYQKDEFELSRTSYEGLDQRKIPEQDLIILSELDNISNPLIQNLESFVQNKGNLVIIPSQNSDLASYNDLLSSFDAGNILAKFRENKSVNKINYDHPFFAEVFENEVYNFQYPIIGEGFVTDFENASPLLEFEDKTSFIAEIAFYANKVYWISAPLSAQETNFVNSPLIVPIFYKFSVGQKNESAIYMTIGDVNEMTIRTEITGDSPVKIVKNEMEFIPAQIRSSDRIMITTEEYPVQPGIYALNNKGELLENIAFNYNRNESKLNFTDLKPLTDPYRNIHIFNSLETALKEEYERNNNKELWQLFIIFALVFLILEILLQKFLKN